MMAKAIALIVVLVIHLMKFTHSVNKIDSIGKKDENEKKMSLKIALKLLQPIILRKKLPKNYCKFQYKATKEENLLIKKLANIKKKMLKMKIKRCLKRKGMYIFQLIER